MVLVTAHMVNPTNTIIYMGFLYISTDAGKTNPSTKKSSKHGKKMSTFEKVTSSLQYNLRPGTFQSKEFFSPKKKNDFRILELLKMIGKSKKIYSPRSQIVV